MTDNASTETTETTHGSCLTIIVIEAFMNLLFEEGDRYKVTQVFWKRDPQLCTLHRRNYGPTSESTTGIINLAISHAPCQFITVEKATR